MVTVEYQIDTARAAEFAEVMQRTRRARLRQGRCPGDCSATRRSPVATSSTSSTRTGSSTSAPARFTAFDAELRTQRLAFHIGAEPPLTRRYVAANEAPPVA